MSEPFIGDIRMFGGNFAPRGWAFCDGQLLAISQNDALFALLGTTYGGDGQTTFALPDFRGRLPVHPGSGPGLTPRFQGEKGGTESVSLTANQLGSHDHGGLRVSAGSATSNDPEGRLPGNSPSLDLWIEDTPSVALAGQSVTTVGNGQPHSNIMPFICVNFIIALFGVFPSQN